MYGETDSCFKILNVIYEKLFYFSSQSLRVVIEINVREQCI